MIDAGERTDSALPVCKTLTIVVTIIAAVLALSCSEDQGPPAPILGQLSLLPTFESRVSGALELAETRVTLAREGDSSLAVDTVATIAPGDTTVDLSVSVMMFSPDETFALTLQLITAQGDTAYRGGPISVTPGTSAATAPEIDLPLEYDGRGKYAAGVRIVTPDTNAFAGDTLVFAAAALDSAGQPIDSVPIEWTSLDSLAATATTQAFPRYDGQVVGVGRGTAVIVAMLPTGQADSGQVAVQPLPSTVVVVSGDSQSAILNTTLADSIVLEVRGNDDLGVSGVPVRFSTPDGGTITPDSSDTDVNGQVVIFWTLGSSVGAQTLAANVLGFGTVETTVAATSLPGPPTGLVFVVQPSDALIGVAIAPPIEIEIIDAFGNRATNDSSTSVDIGITAGTGTAAATLSGTLSRAAVGGVVTFDDLSIDTDGSGYTLDATLPSQTVTTSASFDVSLQLNLVSHWAGDGDATDSTDGNDGVPQGGMGFARGMVGQAFLLDGADDFVNAGNALNLQLSDGPFSVSVWVMVNGAGTDMSLVDKMGPGLNSDGWRLIRQIENRFWFCFGGGGANGCQPMRTARSAAVEVGLWYHLAAVKSSDSIAIYMNGVLQDQLVQPTFTDTHAADLIIGGNTTQGALLDGLVDDVRIYSGALDATQVDSMFNAVLSAAPSRLEFTTMPTAVDSAATIPTIEVTAREPLGNVADTYTGDVTIAIGNDPSGSATLGGTTTVAAAAGVAQFTDLSIDRPGVGFTLVTTATGLEPDTSDAFEIAAPSGVVYWTNPSGGNWNVGSNWSTGAVPAATDSVFIDLAGTYTVTVSGSDSVEALIIGAVGPPTLSVAASSNMTLTVANGGVNAGTITITGGSAAASYASTLTISTGTLVNTGTIRSTVGARVGGRTINGNVDNQGTIAVVSQNLSYSGSGTLTADASGEFSVADGYVLSLNAGTTTILGTGTSFVTTSTGRINVLNDLTLASDFTLTAGAPAFDISAGGGVVSTISGPGTFINADTVFTREDVFDAAFTNQGSLRAVESGGGSTFNGAFTNTATGGFSIEVQDNSGLTLASATGLSNAGTITITGGSAAASYGNTLTISTGTLVNTGTIRSTVGARVGGRTIIGNVDNQGTIAVVSQNLSYSGSGTLTADASGEFSVADGYVLSLNAGTTTILGTGTSFVTTSTGRINVLNDLTLASDFTLTAGAPAFDISAGGGVVSTISGPGTFINADTVFTREDVFDAAFTNQGSLRAMEADGGSTFNGAFTNAATGSFSIEVQNNSGLTLASATGLSNAGTITITGGSAAASYGNTLTISTGTLVNTGTIRSTVGARVGGRTIIGNVDNQGTIAVVSQNLSYSGSGTLTADASGEFSVADGYVLSLNAGTTTILGTGTSFVTTSTGRINVLNDLTLASDFTLTAGAPAFDISAGGGVVSTISGPGTFINADTVFTREDVFDAAFTNQGSLRAVESGGGSTFNGAFTNTATGGFSIEVQDNSGLTLASATGLSNAGTITITGGSAAASYGNTLTISTGTLVNTGTIRSTVGARVGARTINGNVDNQAAGTIAPVDRDLAITGTLTSSGNLDFNLGGTAAGSTYFRLLVSGTATLDGTLNVTLTGGFVPALGNNFTVVTGSPVSGGFTFTNLPAIPNTWNVDTTSGTSVVLRVQ